MRVAAIMSTRKLWYAILGSSPYAFIISGAERQVIVAGIVVAIRNLFRVLLKVLLVRSFVRLTIAAGARHDASICTENCQVDIMLYNAKSKFWFLSRFIEVK